MARVLSERRPGAGERVVILRGEAALVELGGLGVADARLAPLNKLGRP